ncbi:MAG: DNA polymerase III subunit gamma/tau [Lawsonibacter sp.]
MYQALYRKWRPRTFDDVVGQTHITDTLKQQVEGGRLSHAYLFTGTRGTGKTTCAKILARAVNCQAPEHGNPCNRCPACLGIENGSILDVLELDAASNNGVDQVRALRDEAVYTPAAVRKRVYIVDEVHMLSTPAFNALLKILEEPPAHLMFILATTELHKVPATIRSRCQQFTFKRILPGEIAQRLRYVAGEEGIDLTEEGAALLSRLADGGLRDGLSLLDQCSGGQEKVDEQAILDTLGLAGNLETAKLMERIAARDTAGSLDSLARLYANGKDVGSVLGELAALARDLLLRKTAPQGGAALLAGGYDEATMRALGQQFTAQRLLQTLTRLQEAGANLVRSSNRRTDAELCLIRLCDETLDDSLSGLAARVARLEERLSQGVAELPQATNANRMENRPLKEGSVGRESDRRETDIPPWEEPKSVQETRAPKQTPTNQQQEKHLSESAQELSVESSPSPALKVQENAGTVAYTGGQDFWPSFVAGLRGKVPPSVTPYLNNPAKVTGVWQNGSLTLWVDSEFTRSMLNKPAVLEGLTRGAAAAFGGEPKVSIVTGKAPTTSQPSALAGARSIPSEPMTATEGEGPEKDALDELLAFGEQFDNIIIQ